jgi:hypothetical protein
MRFPTLSMALALAITLCASGCAVVGPPYAVSTEVQQVLQELPNKVKLNIGEVRGAPDVKKEVFTGPLSVRSAQVMSPYSGSWLLFLKQALETELRSSGRLDAASSLRIDSEMIENDLIAGIGTGEAKVGARFKIFLNGTEKFDRVFRVRHVWESSFVGAVAIPAAVNNYAAAVQKLLAALFRDKDFQNLRASD